MDYSLPPIDRITDLKSELAQVPKRHRDDAVQEAWLAHLEGRDSVKAIAAYRMRELRHERRTVPLQDDGEGQDHFAVDRDGHVRTEIKPVKQIRRDRKRKTKQPIAA